MKHLEDREAQWMRRKTLKSQGCVFLRGSFHPSSIYNAIEYLIILRASPYVCKMQVG